MVKHSRLSPTHFSTFDCLPTMQAGKRQRRQSAAALVVQSLWSGGKKKQTNGNEGQEATPPTNGNNNNNKQNERPVIEVPPMGFGPIRDPNHNDVLCGRGGLINGSKGNVQFRNIVATRKLEYNAKTTKRNEKAHLAAVIVRHIRNMDPPGRFLREDVNGLWFDIGDAKAIRKTGQALRECAPSIRQEMEGGEGNNNASGNESSDGDEDKPKPNEKPGSPAKPTASMDVPTNKKIAKGKKETKAKQKNKQEATSPKKGMVEATSPSPLPETNSYPKSKASMLPQGPPQIHPMAMAMPRMSGGAVFNNSHSRTNRDSMPPPEQQQQEQQWRGQHPHEYYPAPQHVNAAGHHSMHVYPPTSGSSDHNNMHVPQHQQYHHPHHHPQQHHPPYPYPMHHHLPHHMPYGPNGAMMMNQHGMHAPPVPMQPQSNPNNNDAAFGMSFFAPNDVNMESSERTSSIMSDISGLSSNMTTGKQQQQQHNSSLHTLTADHLAKASEQNGPTHHNNNMMAPPPVAARQQDGSLTYANSGMLDATSSLPGNDDAEMLSSMCGGAVSSLAMASVVSEAQDPNKKPSTLAMMKRSFLGGGAKNHQQQHPSTPVLQPLPPTLSNPAATTHYAGMEAKDGSTCVSGKSEASFPFSVGSMSNFSDDFRALTLNLSEQTELEVPDSNNGAD